MHRRDTFSAIAALASTPIVAACSSDDDDNKNATASCDGAGATTTNVQSHTHRLCVPAKDLGTPPAGGETYVTSTDAGHSHSFMLTQTQLDSIAKGDAVTLTSSVNQGHSHDVTL